MPIPSLGDLSDPGIEPGSPALREDSLPSELPGKPKLYIYMYIQFTAMVNIYVYLGFLGGSDGKESACSAGNTGSILESGRSPGEGNGYPLQYSCLENSMDRGAWWATVHGVAKS